MFLHEFLAANSDELIALCKEKVAKRPGPNASRSHRSELKYGVPVFLKQLIKTLGRDSNASALATGSGSHEEGKNCQRSDIAQSAARHGDELLHAGYTLDGVVHDYGDLCQAVTELARDRELPITAEEFHTLNQCLDDAIAGAVTEYGSRRDEVASIEGTTARKARRTLDQELLTMVQSTVSTVEKIKAGTIGVSAATGAVLDRNLNDMRRLIECSLREERAEHVALLPLERQEVDQNLSSNRAPSDTALATRDEFLGIVGHDLRNMLNSAMGFAALIEKATASPELVAEKVLHYAQRIRRAGEQMNRLVGDLVDVASIEAGALSMSREVGDAAHLVTEAAQSFQGQAEAKQISLTAEFVPAPLLAEFDPTRILQVLTNLLSNALKFTPAKGSVIVRVERIRDEVRFAVSDTGMGIPRDKLETIFQRFVQVTQNDRRGVGLGLYISQRIVQGHGGRIWAESRSGGGSTFCFTLPIAPQHTARGESGAGMAGSSSSP